MGTTLCQLVRPREESPSDDFLLGALFPEDDGQRSRIGELNTRINKLERSFDESIKDLDDFKRDVDELKKSNDESTRSAAKFLPTIYNNDNHSIDIASCHVKVAESITEAECASATTLLLVYFRMANRYKFVNVRVEVGFKSGGKFATLLVHERWKDEPDSQIWTRLLEHCYGKTVQEMADEDDKLRKDFWEDLCKDV